MLHKTVILKSSLWAVPSSVNLGEIILSLISECPNAGQIGGLDFMVMFMSNGGSTDTALEIRTHTYSSSTSVRVNTPAWFDPSYDQTWTQPIASRIESISSTAEFTLNETILMSRNGLANKTVQVTSNNNIEVFGFHITGATCEAFQVLPTNMLGMDYFVIGAWPMHPDAETEIGLIAVEDGTEVNVTFQPDRGVAIQHNGVTYGDGTPLIITLNKNDVFQVASMNDLSGTYISSSQRIAVFSGVTATGIYNIFGTMSHLVEQMLPTQQWGMTYYVLPLPGHTFNILKVMGSIPTDVTVSGQDTPIIIRHPGDFQDLETSARFMTIKSSSKISVAQYSISDYSLSGQDPSMMLVQPYDNFRNSYTFITPTIPGTSSAEKYVLLVVQDGYLPGLRIDGSQVDSSAWTMVS